MSFMDDYAVHFQSYRHNVSDKARQYACGLMQAGSRKNMDRMAEVVPDSKSRNLQQFLTHSKWNHRDVIEHVAQDANDLLGDIQQSCLLIDETGFAKQGKGSVGVTRQWLGRLGKVDNGGGGTVAKYFSRLGMEVIDLGPPVMSMHSPYEVTCKVDIYSSYLAYKAFLMK